MTNETGKGVVSKYSSTYLKNGQKAEEVSTVMDKNGKSTKKTAAYTYDMLGRITRETKTGREDISYTYDANNNRKQMTIGNKTTAYQYNKNDELLRTDTLHTDTEKNDVVIYKNDKNGNQLATVNRSEIPTEAKDTSYIDVDVTLGDNQLNDNVVNHYNALNQLTETLTKNYKVSFTYDAEGLRTGKTVNGEKTVYVWDGDQVVMELSKGGAVQKRYIRGNDLVYADKGENTEKTYYVTDMHGNVVQLLDESGNVTKTYEYDSFGNEVKPEKKDENPYRYCGEYYDKETEEVYLRARYYEPGVGRFITRDTYTGESDEPLSLHLYTYCANDGVNMVDPSGHGWLEWIGKQYMRISGYKGIMNGQDVIAKFNYEENEKLEKKLRGNFIYNQKDYPVGNMLYGDSKIANTGCELVAIYNAISLKKNRGISFSGLIKYSELKGYSMRNGVWGTTPYKIGNILEHYGIKYTVCANSKNIKIKKGKIYIVSVYNKGGLFSGVHTFAVLAKDRRRGYYVYNDGTDSIASKFRMARNNKQLFRGRQYIIGYRLKGRF